VKVLSHFLFSLLFLSKCLLSGQWAVIDTNYSRFALTTSAAALPTNVQHSSSIHHSHHHSHHHQSGGQQAGNDGQNSGNDNLSLGSNHSSSHGSSSNSNSNNTSSIQSQTPVQLQYQTTYSPQIIAVNPNNIVNSYPPISTPTSPIVQSVYSQQNTPIQSPVNIQTSNNSAGGSSSASTASTTSTATPAVPPKRKRSVNPQGEENFLRALDAVRFGGIGFCKVRNFVYKNYIFTTTKKKINKKFLYMMRKRKEKMFNEISMSI
jgi:hypothetical protein